MKRKKQLLEIPVSILVSGSIVFILFGILIGYLWCKSHITQNGDILQYGVAEQNLTIQSITWKNYPTYRELTFNIDGNISFYTESNGVITFNNLANPNAFEEIHREHKVSSNGSNFAYYDYASYNFNDGKVTVNIPKRYSSNPITDTVHNSYYLTFYENEAAYVAGCISVLDTYYTVWTEDEISVSDVNLDAYLTAFTLSGTYDSVKPLHQKSSKEGISLRKEEGSIFAYTIENNTESNWVYENHLPHIELWYKGVWIELNSPFDYNLMNSTIKPSEIQHFETPEEIVSQYPTPFPGQYRLVIYGENGEFIVSDVFSVRIE